MNASQPLDPARSNTPDQTQAHQKRRRSEQNQVPTHRSTNACHRCKAKKLKCHFVGLVQDKCAACCKVNADCQFDRPRDVVNRSAEYVTALETRVSSLESELTGANSKLLQNEHQQRSIHGIDMASPVTSRARESNGRSHPAQLSTPNARPVDTPAFTYTELVESSLSSQDVSPGSSSELTTLNMLQGGLPSFEMQAGTLPPLPSDEVGNLLLETVYLYTQARYCLVDWVQVRDWHQRRHEICYAKRDDSMDAQMGAYFVWIIYAIGANFVPNPEHPPKAYFARARKYLHTVLPHQNMNTVQALLVLCQFQCRATGGPSIWHLSGNVMRLCIELGYHRKTTQLLDKQNPFQIELQKRFFWCAYCFDRIVSTIGRRPFGIHDLDIDVELPVNIDVMCTDNDSIRTLQMKQAAAGDNDLLEEDTITTMSSALHHLQMYRLKSKINTRFFGPHTLPPTHEDTSSLLFELDHWNSTTPRDLPSNYPQQNKECKRGFYLQTMLLLMRPILRQDVVDQDMLLLCTEKAAEACEIAKLSILNPQTHPALVELYQCFYSGVTLLECLTLQTTILSPKRVVRAIVACSSALAVYSRYFPAGAPFVELFEKLSDRFLGSSDDPLTHDSEAMPSMRTILRKIMSSEPYEMIKLLPSLSRIQDEDSAQIGISVPTLTQFNQYFDKETTHLPAGCSTSNGTLPSAMSFDTFLFDDSLREWTTFGFGLEQ